MGVVTDGAGRLGGRALGRGHVRGHRHAGGKRGGTDGEQPEVEAVPVAGAVDSSEKLGVGHEGSRAETKDSGG